MAEIPGSIPLAGVEGTSVGAADTVRPTDFGASQVAQSIAGVDEAYRRSQSLAIRAQAATDRAAVAPILNGVRNDNEEDIKTTAAAYTPGQGGLTTTLTGNAQARADNALKTPGLSPGQRSELQRGLAQETLRVSSMAADHQSTVDALPVAQAAQAQLETQVGAVTTAHLAAFAPQRDALYLNHTSTDTDLPAKVGAAYDAATAQTTANLPPALAGPVGLQLAAGRNAAVAQAQDFQVQHAQAGMLTSIANQTDTLANTVVSSPGSYADAMAKLPQILAPLGTGDVYTAALKEHQAALAQAHIQGLLEAGQQVIAKQQLDSGQFDKFLDPKVKEGLEAQTDAAVISAAPKTQDQFVAQDTMRKNIAANLISLHAYGIDTGQAPLAAVAATLGPKEAADYQLSVTDAQKAYAASGGVHAMDGVALAATANAPMPQPDPKNPENYAQQLTSWQASTQAAKAELQARQQPGAWAFDFGKKPLPGQAAQQGAALQQKYQAMSQAPAGPQAQAAGADYATTMLSAQYRAGVPANMRQIVPQETAAGLVANVNNASPEGKAQALLGLADYMRRLPVSITLPDGSIASPQQTLGRQLRYAGLSPIDFSAIVDFGAPQDAAKLARVIAAEQVVTKAQPPNSKDAIALTYSVTQALKTYQDQMSPLPGAADQKEAQIARTALVARSLILTQHMGVDQAAKQAASDLTAGYVDMGTYRVPQAQAGGTYWNSPFAGGHMLNSGANQIDDGSNAILAKLLANGGAALYPPAGFQGGRQEQAKQLAGQIAQGGRWVSSPDQSGLMLMYPKGDGSWVQVHDQWGRPVAPTWDQLKNPNTFDVSTPPPQTPRQQDGTPVPAFSKASAIRAFTAQLESQESGGRSGLISDQGAYGVRQVLPATAAPYAQRIYGQPLDLNRLQNDDAYNRTISNAIIGDLVNHYGTGAGLGLTAAAYFAGQGNVDRLIATHGDPRTGQVSLDSWMGGIAKGNPKTAAYATKAIWGTFGRLAGGAQ